MGRRAGRHVTEAAGEVADQGEQQRGEAERLERRDVEDGNLVITAGWRSGKLESLYPRGIPVGTVKSVGQQDVDLYKRIQVAPLVEFDSLAEVIVLVPKNR